MRRTLWTVGMAAAGLFLGGKGADTPGDAAGVGLIVIWFASIGYLTGSIFDQKRPNKWLAIYWATLLALVAPFCALPIALETLHGLTESQFAITVAIGALAGVFFGVFAGRVHQRRLRRKVQDAVA